MIPTIQMRNGDYFDFRNPSVLSIHDVAHALSNLCRFTGHCRTFYSVAQHSVLVSMLIPQPYKLWGLLHDAVEAVVGDMASPLKSLIPDYKEIEHRCEKVILAGFDLHGDTPAEVKHADLRALLTEKRDLMPVEGDLSGGTWSCLEGLEPAEWRIEPLGPAEARLRFLNRYMALKELALLIAIE